MKKRFLAWILVVCLLVSAMPLQARAAEVIASGKIGGITWVIDDAGTMILVGTGHFSTQWSGKAPWDEVKSQVQKVVINDGVTGFDTNFLSGFGNLTDVSLPATLKELGTTHFEGCEKLAYLSVDFANPYFRSEKNALLSKDQTTLICVPKGFSGSYSVPATVKTIGRYAFLGNRKLTGVTLPSGLKSLESQAFLGCTKLESITLPSTLESIGISTFESTGLKTITIPANVKSIGNYALDCCEKMTTIQVHKNNAYFSSDGIALFNKDKTKLIQYPLGRYGTYNIPGTVREFTTHAFWFNQNLTGLELPDSLKSIPDKAFKGCSNLFTLEVPHTVQSIGKEIFSADSAPDTVVFYGSAPAIPNGAPFYDPNGTVNMTVYYPTGDQTWSAANRKAYGGKIDWRAGAAMTQFGDVATYQWYFEPVLWAVEEGITSGTSSNTFSPNNICQRAQVVTFLWRSSGSP